MEFSCHMGKNVENSMETPWNSTHLRDGGIFYYSLFWKSVSICQS